MIDRSVELIKRMNSDRALFLKVYGLVNYYLDSNQQDEVIQVKQDIEKLIEYLDKKLYNQIKMDIEMELDFKKIPF